MKIRDVLQGAVRRLEASSSSPRLDAELLLAFVRGWTRLDLIAHSDEELDEESERQFESLLAERLQHVPIAYLTGVREFWGLDFEVTREVLVPRPETELVVDKALEMLAGSTEQLRVLDLGTGSGCIAVSLAKALRESRAEAQVVAVDLSREALEVARRNAQRHGVHEMIEFRQSDWCAGLIGVAPFNLIVSNPPYIATDDTEVGPETAHEPRQALYSGPEGLDAIATILSTAGPYLRSEGVLLIEVGSRQRSDIERLVSSLDEHARWQLRFHRDLAGRDRVLEARR